MIIEDGTITERQRMIGKILISYYDQMKQQDEINNADSSGKKSVLILMAINDIEAVFNSNVPNDKH